MALRADRVPTPGIELTLADAEQLPSTNLLIKMVNLILITMMRITVRRMVMRMLRRMMKMVRM